MAAFPNGNSLTRPDYAGVNSDVDIHLEEHLGIVDSRFVYTSKLAPFLDVHSLRNSNIARLERISSVEVSSLLPGGVVPQAQFRQEKFDIAVDRTLIIRNALDKFDEWTQNRDYRRYWAEEHGSAFARLYDETALIAALKAPAWVPPASIANAMSPGILVSTDVDIAAVTKESADKLVAAHRQSIEQLSERDMGSEVYDEGVTIVSNRIFSILLQHDRLTNMQFGASNVNDFVQARIARLNGVRIIESNRVPKAAKSGHPLGSAFDVTADEAKGQMITILPRHSLIVAQVAPLEANTFYDPVSRTQFIETLQAYNVGLRRPDTVAIVAVK